MENSNASIVQVPRLELSPRPQSAIGIERPLSSRSGADYGETERRPLHRPLSALNINGNFD